jgi:hypothetical protein
MKNCKYIFININYQYIYDFIRMWVHNDGADWKPFFPTPIFSPPDRAHSVSFFIFLLYFYPFFLLTFSCFMIWRSIVIKANKRMGKNKKEIWKSLLSEPYRVGGKLEGGKKWFSNRADNWSMLNCHMWSDHPLRWLIIPLPFKVAVGHPLLVGG